MQGKGLLNINIGKNGLTDGVIVLIKSAFKGRESVKVSVLKAGGHTKENVKEIADRIVASLGLNYTYKTIGFVINLHKWRKAIRKE